jgi:hypothetical protein
MPSPRASAADDPDQRRFCLRCGYSLYALPELRCPECGRAFDPADPLSFARHPRPGDLVCRLSRPLGWPIHTLAAALALLTLSSAGTPGGHFGLMLLSVSGWTLLGFIWLVRLAVRRSIITWYGPLEESRAGRSQSWLVAPVILGLVMLLAGWRIPLLIGFAVSKPAMDRLVVQAAQVPPGSLLQDQRVGLYVAENIVSIPGGVRFLVRGSGFIDRSGFAFCVDGLPLREGNDRYDPLGRGWYVWHLDF